MSDLSTPLTWDFSLEPLPTASGARDAPSPSTFARTSPAPLPSHLHLPARTAPNAAAPVARTSAPDSQPPSEKAIRAAYAWPTPPYASYPLATPQTDPLPCEIGGLNGKRTTGRITFFLPEQGVVQVQLPPARTTLPLRFEQFVSLTLTTPLLPTAPGAGDPHARLLGHRARSGYTLTLASGVELEGETVGYVENDYGLFLFPPLAENPAADDDGAVTRLFYPRSAYARLDIGSSIGELLVEQQSATPAQIAQAVGAQQQLRERKLGDVLVTQQVVSSDQLIAAIERQARMPMVRIGEALISLGMVSPPQLQAALTQQQVDRSVPLGELLVRMNVVSREDLQIALARKMGYPLVDIDSFPAEPEALKKLAYSVAMRLKVMPLLVREGRLVVALDDPARRRAAVDEVEFNVQMKVVPVLAHTLSIESVVQSAYQRLGLAEGASGGMSELTPLAYDAEANASDKLVETLEKEQLDRAGSDDDRPLEQSDNSLVKLLNTMIIEAWQEGASDIHIESYPGREKIRVRFRKDGTLRTYLELPSNYRNALIGRVKIMCDLDISEKRKPQDGKINFAKFSPQHKLELRVATIPTNHGLEDVVMRLLASAKPIPVDQLGLSAPNLKALKQAVERPYGMVLCVGPTGSGKTTTLHSALGHINVPERKIWTAEDPVEITQPGLRQVQVNPKIEWTFAKALRAFLRADPDVIMVGEIRDSETAGMAVEASLTGHLVLSTLHTNSAPETVTRLLDMGLDPFNFGDSILAILAQRLVKKLCAHCRTSRPATPEQQEELLDDYLHVFDGEAPMTRQALLAGWMQKNSRDGRLMLYTSPGCKQCGMTGYKGRAGLHELMTITREVRRLVQTRAAAEQLQQAALAAGMRTLRQDGIDKVLAGITSIEEVRATSNV